MRILISAGIFPPDAGGPASYVPAIATALSRRGHDVEIVCLSDKLADGAEFPFPVVRVARGGSKMRRFVVVVRELRRRRGDVIYANGLSLEGQTAGDLGGTPVVHKIVGDWAWERARNRNWYRASIDEYQSARKGPRLRLLDWLRTAPLKRAEGLIAPSRYLKDTVTAWGITPGMIQVIYNALPPVAAEPPAIRLSPFPGSTLMTVCRLVPWKGVEGLLDLIRAREDWRLVVVGDGPFRPTLEARAASLDIGDRVSWMGWRPHAEVQALLLAADVFVLNSTYEGLPHVVLEAMRAGVAVVATAVGGTPEVVSHGQTGLLVPAGDHRALIEAVAEIVSSPAKARELIDNARAWTQERFGFEAMVTMTERALAAAVSARSPTHSR